MGRGPPAFGCLQFLQGTFSHLAAVHAGGAEEHDRVLNVLQPEPPKRFEVFGEDPDRAPVGALEEVFVVVRKWLMGLALMILHVRKTVSFPQDNEGAPMLRRSAAVLAFVFAGSFYAVSSGALQGASQAKQ